MISFLEHVLGLDVLLNGFPYVSRILFYITATMFISILLSKVLFRRKHCGSVPGPRFVLPLVGGLIDMIRNPYLFWEQQRMYNPQGLSWNSILGKYMLFSAKAETSQKIFTINSKDTLTLALHPNAITLLGSDNIAFMTGPEHKELRKSFLHLFNVKALGIYLHMQEKMIRKHVDLWIDQHPLGSTPVEMRELLRQLSAETSQNVFIGPYLRDPKAFSADYLTLTQGFLSAPIYFPGTGLWNACRARERIVTVITQAVREAKEYIQKYGSSPRCLLDFWAEEILRECNDAISEGKPAPAHAAEDKMACTIMDFLFASQDATTAGTSWVLVAMADHPDVLEKVCAEQAHVRPANEPVTLDLLQEMTYARQVVLECLRHRPPAPMMPMMTHSDLTFEGVPVPKGTLLVASIWSACMEGFPNPHQFDPARMGPERQEDKKYQKQYMPFGVGPHRCVGYTYAINHLTLFLVTMATRCQFVRKYSPNCNEVVYFPTLYPKSLACTFAPPRDSVKTN